MLAIDWSRAPSYPLPLDRHRGHDGAGNRQRKAGRGGHPPWLAEQSLSGQPVDRVLRRQVLRGARSPVGRRRQRSGVDDESLSPRRAGRKHRRFRGRGVCDEGQAEGPAGGCLLCTGWLMGDAGFFVSVCFGALMCGVLRVDA